jgi:hypothetical protein
MYSKHLHRKVSMYIRMVSHLFDDVVHHSWQAVRIILKEFTSCKTEDFACYTFSYLRAIAQLRDVLKANRTRCARANNA